MALLWDVSMALLRRDYERVIERLLQHYREHGESFQINVNSSQKTLGLTVVMKESPSPLHIRITAYSLQRDNGQLKLVCRGVETPWRWVDMGLRAFKGEEVSIAVPSQYATFVESLL